MVYTDTDGKERNPYIIHRTSIGCYERTLALLIEKYGGAFPMWLAPEQVCIIPIADRHLDYSNEIAQKLQKVGIRVKVDGRAEKVGYKIRQAQLEKFPYMLILGDDEVANNTVAVRSRKDGDIGLFSYEDLENLFSEVINNKI
jgi:threonyl-tRNA synthetase